MMLWQLYTKVKETVDRHGQRKGQALFNCVHEVRPDIARKLQEQGIDPFYSVDETVYTKAIAVIETEWFTKPPEPEFCL